MAATPLENIIKDEIRKNGRITFARYMELALYHPEYGYYSQDRTETAEDDYQTAPQISAAFGKCIARSLWKFWVAADRPLRWDIVEFGAGNGKLAYDIISYIEKQYPDFFETIRYDLIEQNRRIESHRTRLRKYLSGGRCRNADLKEFSPGSVTGSIISNEFFDALPVHRLLLQNGELQEIYVAIHDGNGELEERTGPLSSDEVRNHWDRYGSTLKEGEQGEISLAACDHIRKMSLILKEGVLFTFDYGGDADELFGGAHPDGTVMTYRKHEADARYYDEIGSKDITADCNFSALKTIGSESGLIELRYGTQSKYLADEGILDLSPAGDDIKKQNERNAIRQLLDFGGGFGKEFKVLIQKK